jgi:hypothetical protein
LANWSSSFFCRATSTAAFVRSRYWWTEKTSSAGGNAKARRPAKPTRSNAVVQASASGPKAR